MFESLRQPRAALLAVCLLALVIGSVGLTDEGYASLDGDMPRYLMNGVFLRDLATDRPFGSVSQLLEYTQLYYARYPALSLGHHPVFLPVLEAPVFALFGISVTTARLVPLASLILAVGFLFKLVNDRYGPLAAVFASALLAASPMVVITGRSVAGEMPALAMILGSAWCLERFCETDRRLALAASAGLATLSLYTKPLAWLLVPAVAVNAIAATGIRRWLKRDVLLILAAAALVSAPAVVIPLALSPTNVAGIATAVRFTSEYSFMHLLWLALGPQLAWPVLVATGVAAGYAVIVRDRRALLFLLSIPSVLPALYLFAGMTGEGSRYTLYWVPAWCALAGSLLRWRHRALRAVVVGVLAIGFALQVSASQTIADRIPQAGGYEEAAQFVLSASPGPTVLFSGDVDTGYFVFFVRKHDPARRLVVLRSDKVYTTSQMASLSVEDRIQRPEEIYAALHTFGTRYVVVEDRPSRSRVLEWLRQELKSSRFIERRRIPIRTTDFRLRGTSLAIFELVDHTPPDPNAVLSLNMPLVGQSLSVALSDLISRKFLR